jgi:fibronectin-binding autotransporter adhesin
MNHPRHRKIRHSAAIEPRTRARRPCPVGVSLARYRTIAAVCGALVAGGMAPAATVYLDNNGSAPGSGIVGGSSILWDATTPIWNNVLGTGTSTSWTANDTAIFAAGSDAGNPFTVTVSGVQSIGGLTFQIGGVTLAGAGSLRMTGNANFDVATNLTDTVNTVIEGTSDLTKTGAGTLVLGGANTYAGRTRINGGTLSISSDGNLGAVPALTADSLSFTGSSTLQFTGGDATLNANRGLTIGNSFTGTVQVVPAASTLTSGGLITGAAGTTFNKTGDGALELQGNSTAMLGALSVDGGTLKLSGNGALANTSGVTLSNRATLALDNSGTNLGDRTAGALTSNGGTINFIGNAASSSETLGALTLNPGGLTINSTAGAGGAILIIPTLARGVAGGTLYLNGNGLGGASNNVVLSSAPALVNSILKYAVVNDGTRIAFANYATSGGANQSVVPLASASHNQGAQTTWVSTNNARPTVDVTMTADRSLYTITLDSGIDLLAPTADRILTLGGAFLQTGGVSVVGTAGGSLDNILAWGTNEAVFHVLGSLQLNRGDAAASLTGSGGFTKTGSGTLILNGVSTLTGAFNANEGVLELRGGTSLMTTTGATLNLNGANLRLTQVAGFATGTSYTANAVVNADTTITVSRVDNPGTRTGPGLRSLSIGGGRKLSVNALNLTAGSPYELSFLAGTLTGPATFEVANNGSGLGTLALTTLPGAFPVTKTGAGDLMLYLQGAYPSVVDIQAGRVGWDVDNATITEPALFSGTGGLHKAGDSTVNLTGASTFTGSILVAEGTLGFTTVSNNGGGPSNLGQGTDGITVGVATLSFTGSTNQSTTRKVTLTGGTAGTATGSASALNAGGSGGAVITFAGGIDGTTTVSHLVLTGNTTTSNGAITGGITQTSAGADVYVNSGTWALSGTPTMLAGNFVVTGSTAILNLNSTGVLGFTSVLTNGLLARSGAIINLGAHDVHAGADFFALGDVGAGTLNMGAFNVTVPRLDLGDGDSLTDTGAVTGTGVLTVPVAINLFRGTIAARLAGAGVITKDGIGQVTLSGDSSGLTTAAGPAVLEQGTLVLSYTTSNTAKLAAGNALIMSGATLILNGNASADTSQSVSGLTLTNSAPNTITVNRGGTRSATLNLGNITRTAGTIRFNLPAAGAITTATANTNGVLGGWATVTDSTGTNFAANDGANNIVAVATTAKDAVSTWAAHEHLTDTAAYAGTLATTLSIGSLRFNAAGPSTVAIGDGLALGLDSGGILQTAAVTAGISTISGGKLVSAAGSELIFQVDSASRMLTVASSIAGGASITKSGSGTLRLTGANSYTGATRMLSGTLQVSGGNALPDTAPVAFSADQSSVLELLSNETIGPLSGGGNSATLTALSELRFSTNVLTVNQTTSGTFGGNLNGSSLIKTGAGDLIFDNGVQSNFGGTVTVNQGLFSLSGGTKLPFAVHDIAVNRASFLLDGNGGATASHLDLGASITLDAADGSWSGESRPSGLAVRRDQSSYSAPFSTLTLNAGANYTRLDAATANTLAALISEDIVRLNGATLDVRGTNLSATSGQRGQLRIYQPTNQSNFIAAMVGGGSTTLGTKTISIVPWAIAEEYTGGLGDANMGNSFATYVLDNGLRALNLSTEYSTFAAKASTKGNVRESLAASLTGVAGQTLNALVLNNSNTATNTLNVTGTGSGQTLAVTSGGLLFTATAAVTGTPAIGITLGGFDAGITVGATNEYVIFVQNPTSAAASGLVTAAISSPLTSAADITKSGRGTLILTTLNTAGGGAKKTTINEGVLQIADLDNIGGNTGALVFAGGTLKLGAGFADDLSTRSITFRTAGGTLDTNGINLSLSASIGTSNGGFTKIGAGNLTLNAAANYTGGTIIAGGAVTLGVSQGIGTGALTVTGASTLAMGVNNATVAGLTLDNAANVISGTGTLTVNGAATVNWGSIAPILAGSMNLLKLTAGATVTLSNAASTFTGYTHVQDGTLSIASLANAGVASSLGAPTGDNAAIRLGNLAASGTLIHTGGTSSTNRMIVLPGATGGGTIDNDGTGALTLGGNITGTEYGAKTLTLQGTTTGFANVVSGVISDGLGTLGLTKSEPGTWSLASANTFTGATTVTDGTLELSGSLTATSDLNLNAGVFLLGASNAINNGAALNLAGGTFRTGGFSEGDAATVGLGLLRVNASSVLDFGVGGSSQLLFAGLGNHAAGATLSIVNWSNGSDQADPGPDRLMFAGNDAARIAFQSAFAPGDISFNGYFGFATQQLDPGHFEVIPEPSAGLLALSALSFLGFRRSSHRRRAGRGLTT